MGGFKPVKPKDPNRKPAAAFFLEDPKENEPDLIERIFVKLEQILAEIKEIKDSQERCENIMENRFDQLNDRLEKMEKSLINLQK